MPLIDGEALETIMRTEKGRRFIAELLKHCGVGSYSMTGNIARDRYDDGRRSVGEDILRQISAIQSADEAKDGLALEYTMRREAKRREEEEEDE